ncbi:hypothetical protein SERLA73DRAFT_191605 [Serpula lacrymans var. lacrymans S7.3]|uniref:Uncharacterized protein n=1 Tax=Serpula lacrymans var. lacrymans (strain S7.3) TaxID=936435 RepID=F8QHX5_SERL3|nr:hypothetical protein SERLA73DRAFT_191605 [Serpula lacrymans var. lacrymans S7.3]
MQVFNTVRRSIESPTSPMKIRVDFGGLRKIYALRCILCWIICVHQLKPLGRNPVFGRQDKEASQ